MVWKEQIQALVTRTGIYLRVPLRSPALVVTAARVIRSKTDPGYLEVYMDTEELPTTSPTSVSLARHPVPPGQPGSVPSTLPVPFAKTPTASEELR